MRGKNEGIVSKLIGVAFALAMMVQSHWVWAATPWSSLSPKQKELLEPVRSNWTHMSASQQERWLKMSERYASENPERQAMMRERVGGWHNLSPQERAEARRNYTLLKEREQGERNSSWNSYQTLQPQQRNEYLNNHTLKENKRSSATRPF